jgi:hypothetical protein
MLHANWHFNCKKNHCLVDINRTIQHIKYFSPNSKIFIIGNVPQWPEIGLPKYMLAKGMILNHSSYLFLPMFAELRKLDEQLKDIAQKNDVYFLSALDQMCVQDKCQTVANINNKPEPTAWDYAHLTAAGSFLLAKKLLATTVI